MSASILAIARRSLSSAVRERRLVLLLWAVHLLLALVAIAPFHAYFVQALAAAPEGDRLLTDFDLPLLFDLGRGLGNSGPALRAVVIAVFALGLLWNALAAGGAIETLRLRDPRPLAVRFGRGAGRYFWRFARLGLFAVACSLLVGGLLSAPLWIVRAALGEERQAPRYFLFLGGVAIALLGITLALLALDLARIRVAELESRRPLRVYLRTLRQVIRRPARLFALWAVLFLTLVAVTALCLALRAAIPPGGGLALALTFLLQQAVALARAFYRVALWSGELALDRRL